MSQQQSHHHANHLCFTCGTEFRLWREERRPDGRRYPTREMEIHNLDQDGIFCSQRCAVEYAVREARETLRGLFAPDAA